MTGTGPRVVPFGAWPSPITAARLVEGTARIGEARVDGDDVWWAEARPSEGGRIQLVRMECGAAPADVLPEGWNARTRVHEYGGGAWSVRDGVLVFSNWADQRLWRLDLAGGADGVPQALTPDPPAPAGLRYADGEITADGRWLICVRESHGVPGATEAVNEVVAVPLDGAAAGDGGLVRVLVSGPDFVSSPTVSPDGAQLAWVQWDHPAMPWDATEVRVAPFDPTGGPRGGELVAGGPRESVVGPQWSGDGSLLFCSDRTGWWNPYRAGALSQLGVPPEAAEGDRELVVQELVPGGVEGEVGGPAWVFGGRWLAELAGGRVVASCTRRGLTELVVVEAHGVLRSLDLPFTEVGQVVAAPGGDTAVVVAGSPTSEPAVWLVDPSDDGTATPLRLPDDAVDEAWISPPEPITFATGAGATAHALLYRPANPEVVAPDGERPPLLVLIHGGPTSAARPALSLARLYWTSRGFAVADVNYRGSTGYGRPYRDALRGQWGVADVEDCAAAARHLAQEGVVDPARLAIRGGSAGGFTTLAALAFLDVFAAGASHYGVADLGALARETHKFESRYLDGLVGHWPDAQDVYEARSPISHTDGFDRPLIVFQGLEDEVVPPNQAEAIVAALAAKGVPHAYVPFEGEQHGFRRAENIVRALEAELWFYGRVFGFEPADAIEPVEGAVGL